ncbi:hypothetical protein FSP39_021645 [Pinctada imbricata]|uniref:Uncharacterized protein n=1 Tax=Pinctada imbricata TaxID=66713 RepID=A0AA89C289_PINIB|nr:hypothetical protein FSP39_021645 [Pinctada imbricata]
MNADDLTSDGIQSTSHEITTKNMNADDLTSDGIQSTSHEITTKNMNADDLTSDGIQSTSHEITTKNMNADVSFGSPPTSPEIITKNLNTDNFTSNGNRPNTHEITGMKVSTAALELVTNDIKYTRSKSEITTIESSVLSMGTSTISKKRNMQTTNLKLSHKVTNADFAPVTEDTHEEESMVTSPAKSPPVTNHLITTKLTTKLTTTTKQTTSSSEYSASIEVEEEWNSDLDDPSSDAYQQKVEEYLNFGSVVVDFEVIFVDVQYDEIYLKSTFNTAYYSVFNPTYTIKDEFTTFKRDLDECAFNDWNDCSENATCINTYGKYYCTCLLGYIDASDDITYPGRLCLAISEAYKDPIQSLSISADPNDALVGEEVNFLVSMSRGSHVTITISYGDGNTLSISHPEILSFRSPVTLSHKYASADNFSVIVSARNDISFKVTSTTVTILDKVEGFILNDIQKTNVFPANVEFIVQPQSNNIEIQNVFLHWNFNNETKVTVFEQDISRTNPVSKTSSFNVGINSVSVNISNARSSQLLHTVFFLEESLGGLHVESSKNVTQPGTAIILHVTTMAGSNIIFKIKSETGTIEEKSLKNIIQGSTSSFIPLIFINQGIYNICVQAENSLSSETVYLNYLIFVEYPLEDLLMSADSVTANPPGNINLYLTYNGDFRPPYHMTCHVSLKGNIFHSSYIDYLKADQTKLITAPFDDVDVIDQQEITMECSNHINSFILSAWTIFQQPIGEVSIRTDTLYVPVGGKVYFTFYLQSGSHAKYSINLGNGKTLDGRFEDILSNNASFDYTETYIQFGKSLVSLTVSNTISSAESEIVVTVLQEIIGLKVIRFYTISDYENIRNYGHGESGNVFPLERKITFETSLVTGNDVTYHWSFGDDGTLTTLNPTVSYNFPREGYHIITLHAYNALYHLNKTLEISIQKIVVPHSLRNDGPKRAYETMSFTLDLSEPGTDPCYLWNMGDNSPLVIYGGDACRQKAQLNNYVYIFWSPSPVLHLSHMYTKNETFTVQVSGFNTVSTRSVESFAIVSGISCHYPIVHIIGGGQRFDRPVSKLKSDWINLESSAEINCDVSNGPIYKWTIYKVTQGKTYLDQVYNEYQVSAIAQNHFNILFPPGSFLEGIYRISLNVSMTGIPGLFTEDFSYLNVSKSPLFVSIIGGSARAVGYDNMFTLDAGSVSYDPDMSDKYDKSGMTIEWRCRQEHESYPTDILLVNIPTVEEIVNATYDGGCFGTGPGILNMTKTISKIELSSLLFQPESANVIEVYIRKDTRQGSFKQVLNIVNGDPPSLNIRCSTNCNSKMNPSSPFIVVGECLSCKVFDKISYNWSLYLENTETEIYEQIHQLSSLVSSGSTTRTISFLPYSLIGGRNYKLSLDVNVYGYTPAFSEYSFITNLPPYGGECRITPETGYALETPFVIACSGWINPGEEDLHGAGLLYRFWSRPRGTLDTQLLFYGTEPYTPDSLFRLGPENEEFYHNVIVRIANPIGEFVEKWLEVQVKDPEDENVEDFLRLASHDEDSALTKLFSSGKSQEGKQMIMAISSLINVSPVKIGVSRASLIQEQLKIISGVSTETDNTMISIVTTEQGLTTQKLTVMETTIDPVQLEEEKKRNEQEKQQRIKLRESLLETLSATTDSLTLDSLQQTAKCFSLVTQESSELSETSQEIAVDAMSKMANSFQNIVESSRNDLTLQQFSTGEDILASIGSVITAATGSTSLELTLLNLQDSSDEDISNAQGSGMPETTQSYLTETIDYNSTTISPHQQKENSRKRVKEIARKALNIADVVYQTVIKNRVPGEPPVILESPLLTIIAQRNEPTQLNNTKLEVNTGSFKMPAMDIFLQESTNISYIDTKILSSISNPYVWDDSAKFIGTPVLTLDLYKSNEERVQIQDLETDIVIDITTVPSVAKITRTSFPIMDKTSLSYHSFDVRSNFSSVHILVEPEDMGRSVKCYVKFDRVPSESDFDFNVSIPRDVSGILDQPDADLEEELRYTIFLSPEFIQQYGPGTYYLGLIPESNDTSDDEYDDYDDYYSDYGIETAPDLFNYTTRFITSGCYFWKESSETWVSDGCKWGVAPLSDNIITDTYYYQITVCTGFRRAAGTKSNIFFILAGNDGDTGVRQLIDEKGIKTCSRGSVNNFVMGTRECIGPLSYMRVWHDNSGKGKLQGWYLSKVIITDIQTGEAFWFLCNRWLAVEEDDGMVDRLLPVASDDDLATFHNLFISKTKRNFTDSHLWISIFVRPYRSTFTRVQRVSCILSLVMTTMMANAMFFGAEDNVQNKESFILGPFEFTLHGLYISFVSGLVILPVNILIDFVFRKTKPKENRITNAFSSKNVKPSLNLSHVRLKLWSPSDDTKVVDMTDYEFDHPPPYSLTNNEYQGFEKVRPDSVASTRFLLKNRKETSTQPKRKKNCGKFMLPHCFIYLGWSLVFLSSIISAFITFLYSIQWGKKKSLEWLLSMILSIFESVVVVQPLKIIILAMILSLILRKPEAEEETGSDDGSVNGIQQDEEPIEIGHTKAVRPCLKVDPPDHEKLAVVRQKRLKEIKMYGIIREIVFYLCFLAIIILVSSHNRDPKAFHTKETLVNLLGINTRLAKVRDVDGFWSYLKDYLVHQLYTTDHWNGEPLPDSQRRLVSSMVAYRVGPLRVRQQRVRKDSCQAIPLMHAFVSQCSREWSVRFEDDTKYRTGWMSLRSNETVDNLMNYPWKHKSLFDNAGVPYVGEFGVYPGGGYVVDLIGKKDRVVETLDELLEFEWINKYSRVLFIEFTVYNPQANMFSTVLIVFEMPTIGQLHINYSIKTFRLFSYLGGYGIFVILSEIAALACVVYFIVREVKIFKRTRTTYLKSFWNIAELVNLLLAITAIVMYILRHILTQHAVKKVTKLRDKFYDFQKVALWDETFNFILAFTIFIAILKLVHILRFNRKMSMMAGILRNAAKELSAFVIVFVLFILAYAAWGYIMFGPKMASYRSMIDAIETLLNFSLGSFDYLALENANRIFGPIFFFAFFFTIMFILLNIFVTILNESISTVKDDVSKQTNEYELVAFIWQKLKDWSGLDLDRIVQDVKRKYDIGKINRYAVEFLTIYHSFLVIVVFSLKKLSKRTVFPIKYTYLKNSGRGAIHDEKTHEFYN